MKAMKTVEEILYKVWKKQLSVTNGSAEIVSMIEVERAKNAALVDRIELALSLSEDSDINRILGNALAANEKGGKGE